MADIPRPSDPFDCIQDGSSEYEGTILETTAERSQREKADALRALETDR